VWRPYSRHRYHSAKMKDPVWKWLHKTNRDINNSNKHWTGILIVSQKSMHEEFCLLSNSLLNITFHYNIRGKQDIHAIQHPAFLNYGSFWGILINNILIEQADVLPRKNAVYWTFYTTLVTSSSNLNWTTNYSYIYSC